MKVYATIFTEYSHNMNNSYSSYCFIDFRAHIIVVIVVVVVVVVISNSSSSSTSSNSGSGSSSHISSSNSIVVVVVVVIVVVTGLSSTTYCVQYPHVVLFLRYEMPYSLLKTPKTHAV